MNRFKEFYRQYILVKEGAQDKINRLQKVLGNSRKVNNILKVFIMKHENLIDWNVVFNNPNHPLQVIEQQLSDYIEKMMLPKVSPHLRVVVNDFIDYMVNNNYPKSFIILFTQDFNKKYKNTRSAIPEIQPHVIGDLVTKVKDMSNFGSLMDLYKELDKESVAGGNGALTEQWVVIPSKKNDPEGYEKNKAKLMSYSACKTGWCVRGSGMASSYMESSDFHLYLDDEGDAVVSLRVIDGNIEEVSGTEGGNSQTVSEEYQSVTVEYVNRNKYKLGEGGGVSEDMYDENIRFTENNIGYFMDEFHNWKYYVDVYNGDEHLEYFDMESDNDELWSRIDRNKVIQKAIEEDYMHEEDVDDNNLLEFLEHNYDFYFHNLYSNVYENVAYDKIAKELIEKVEEISGMGIIANEVKTLDDTIELISLEKYKELVAPKLGEGMTIESFFEEDQPQIQNEIESEDILDEHPELSISRYIEEEIENINEPYDGWGKWDDRTMDELMKEHPDVLSTFSIN